MDRTPRCPRCDAAQLKDVRTLLFESVRELLFNAVKHAQVESVTLELALDADDQLCITVSDQGVGFEQDGLDHRSDAGQVGWGLFSIRERVTLLGGRFEIDSAPGKGTRMRLVAPRGDAQSSVADPATSTTTPIGATSGRDKGDWRSTRRAVSAIPQPIMRTRRCVLLADDL
jgi:anti-sigma regulatory factor (Ser/Thr protein kinase)